MVILIRIRYDRLDRSLDINAVDETISAKEIVQYWVL